MSTFTAPLHLDSLLFDSLHLDSLARASFIKDILSSSLPSLATPLVDQLLGSETATTSLSLLDDAVQHWVDAQQEVEASGAALADAQQTVVGAASLEDFDEALQATTLARDEARMAHVAQLDAALALHAQSGSEAQRGRLQDEAARLFDAAANDPPGALGAALTRRLRLEHLHTKLLPVLDEWAALVPGWQAESEEISTHADQARELCDTTKLRALRDTCTRTKKALRAAREDVEEDVDSQPPPPGAHRSTALIEAQRRRLALALALTEAQRAVQRTESIFRRERARLSQLAAAHFPELLALEPLLHLGAAEGAAFQQVLVERKLEQYTGPDGRDALVELANHLNARHRVFR